MDKDKEVSAVADFLGEFGNKGEQKDPFKDNQADLFTTQETVEPEVSEIVKEEKPLPFNKDPKIQKYLDKREKEIEERIKNSIQTSAPAKTEDDFKEVMDSLTAAIGNDTPEKVSALNAFQKALTGLDKRASEKAIAHLEEIQSREVAADKEAEEELERGFDSIEEVYDVDITSNNAIARKTRQEFVTFIEKIAPKDRNGDIVDYPDMASAWETFSELKKSTATPSRAKELASRSMARSSEVSNATAIPANKYSFERSDNFLESLSKSK